VVTVKLGLAATGGAFSSFAQVGIAKAMAQMADIQCGRDFMSVLPEIDLEFTERAKGCGQKVKNRSIFRNCGVKLVVEYSSTANTHPEGVRLVVLKAPPE